MAETKKYTVTIGGVPFIIEGEGWTVTEDGLLKVIPDCMFKVWDSITPVKS